MSFYLKALFLAAIEYFFDKMQLSSFYYIGLSPSVQCTTVAGTPSFQLLSFVIAAQLSIVSLYVMFERLSE